MEEKTTMTDEAIYRLMADSYTESYKFRTYLFKKILRHMLQKIKTEPTIYFLMQTVKENRK